jgi:hypothetical protein
MRKMSMAASALLSTAALAAFATPAAASIFVLPGPSAWVPGNPTTGTITVPVAVTNPPVLADINFTLGAQGSVNGTSPPGTAGPVSDVFSFLLNGNLLFQGSYALGGGGTNFTFTNILGGTITPVSMVNGGTLTFEGVSLLDGANTFEFNFDSTDPTEQFRLEALNITAAVPEPGTWLMMILGFAAVGGMMRRKASVREMRVRYT